MTNLKTRFIQAVSSFRERIGRIAFCLYKKIGEIRICIKGGRLPKEEMLTHLGRLIDSVASGIISLDRTGRIRIFNQAAEVMLGLPRGAVIGLSLPEVARIISADSRGLRGFLERLSDAVWAAGAAIDIEYDMPLQYGARRIISYSVYPLGSRPWSVDDGVVIVFDDITRRKDMEDQVYDTKKKLQTVFDGITDGIQVVDNEFRVIAVNKSMSSLMGRNIQVGRHCYEACVFGMKICEDCPAEETFGSGRSTTITKHIQSLGAANSDGRERIVEITTFPLYDRGNRVVQVVEYVKDVTERVRLAERLEHSRRLAQIGEMAARVAHEVRNPLNAIIGAAHFLATEYADSDTARKFTDLIVRQATRVNQVASDLLSISRPQGIRLTDVNINAVIEQVLDAMCEQIKSQKIAVRTDIDTDIPLIRADVMQIEQAVQNLVRNAVEAMPEGGKLTITTKCAGDDIIIKIEDSGPGIPKAERERVFQSFYTTKTRGTGLGLTIVRSVLERHGGGIEIEQPETSGTRVMVRLPITDRFRRTRLGDCIAQGV